MPKCEAASYYGRCARSTDQQPSGPNYSFRRESSYNQLCMSAVLEILVYDKHRVAFKEPLHHTVELGRQNVGEPAPFRTIQENGDTARLIIAPLSEASVSRRHALLEPRDGGQVCITNLSQRLPIRFDDGPELEYGQSRAVFPQILIVVGLLYV
jgi:hypothetical protein